MRYRVARVSLISHAWGKYGAERCLLETVDALQSRGIEARVFLPRDGPLGAELTRRGVGVHILPYEWWVSQQAPWRLRFFKARRNLQCLPRLVKQIQRWKADLICSNTLLVGIGALAAWLLRKPHLWFIHELLPEGLGLQFDFGEPMVLGIVARLSTLCVANSRFVADHYRMHIAPAKLRVLYPAVEVDGLPSGEASSESPAVSATHGRTLRCALVGRVVPEKGHAEAVEAVGILAKAGLTVELDIVGDGDPAYTRWLSGRIREAGLQQQVRLLGYHDSPALALRNADVLLMCSRAEAFGRVTVEAMKLGRPVIGRRSGATPELIRHGWNGLLYEPGNARDLAAKIRYLYDNPSARIQMGETARTWARSRFNLGRYTDELLAILNELPPARPG